MQKATAGNAQWRSTVMDAPAREPWRDIFTVTSRSKISRVDHPCGARSVPRSASFGRAADLQPYLDEAITRRRPTSARVRKRWRSVMPRPFEQHGAIAHRIDSPIELLGCRGNYCPHGVFSSWFVAAGQRSPQALARRHRDATGQPLGPGHVRWYEATRWNGVLPRYSPAKPPCPSSMPANNRWLDGRNSSIFAAPLITKKALPALSGYNSAA
jgi:hypothetical protein